MNTQKTLTAVDLFYKQVFINTVKATTADLIALLRRLQLGDTWITKITQSGSIVHIATGG